MPSLDAISWRFIHRALRRLGTFSEYDLYCVMLYSLKCAMRYMRLFAAVLLACIILAYAPLARADTYECTRLTLANDGITVTEIETIPCPDVPIYITEDDPRWTCATMGNRICGDPMRYVSISMID